MSFILSVSISCQSHYRFKFLSSLSSLLLVCLSYSLRVLPCFFFLITPLCYFSIFLSSFFVFSILSFFQVLCCLSVFLLLLSPFFFFSVLSSACLFSFLPSFFCVWVDEGRDGLRRRLGISRKRD